MFESNVFDRTSTDSEIINPRLYNLIIGLSLLYGFMINWIMVTTINPEVFTSLSPWVFYLGYFATCFLGCYLFNSSDNPIISLLGYTLVILPFGMVLNVFLVDVSSEEIISAIESTGMVTVTMMILGTLFPKFFEKIAPALFISLLAAIVIELIMIFVFNHKADFMNWVVILIFSGYIGVDWGRANAIPKTVDNAIDSSAALYMDIINIFVRFILANKK